MYDCTLRLSQELVPSVRAYILSCGLVPPSNGAQKSDSGLSVYRNFHTLEVILYNGEKGNAKDTIAEIKGNEMDLVSSFMQGLAKTLKIRHNKTLRYRIKTVDFEKQGHERKCTRADAAPMPPSVKPSMLMGSEYDALDDLVKRKK